MSMDDCFIPFHYPLREPAPYERLCKGSHPCLSQLDLDESSAATAKVRGEEGSKQGEQEGVSRRTLQILNRPIAVPLRRLPRPLGSLPKLPAGSPSLYKENLPEETKQHPPQVAAAAAAPKGRYARSRAGWFSKERSTPEGINMEEHGWRTNNTKFELVEVKVISIFFECGAGCIHYNFTAKQPEDHNPADDAGVPKLFFSELDHRCRNEDDVMLCCIVGENDAGHCHGCEDYQPVVHPSSQAYGGGSTTFIDLPCSDGDSTDSDY